MISGCGLCGKQSDLSKCSACKAIRYCCREHQIEHRSAHKVACGNVLRMRRRLELEEQKLRDDPDKPLETCVGIFWGVLETRDYMRARSDLTNALKRVDTRLSVEMQLDHIMNMLRLCRGDNLGVRDVVPGLMLRLSLDQECFDFVKWWAVVRQGNYNWGDPDLPYLDIKDADSFESMDWLCIKYMQISHGVPMALLKIRLLFDVCALHDSESPAISGQVPREVLDMIQTHAFRTNIVQRKKENLQSSDYHGLVNTLKAQIRRVWSSVRKENKHMWPLLLQPGEHLRTVLGPYMRGDISEAEMVLQLSYDSWIETPGAIEVIRTLERTGDIKE